MIRQRLASGFLFGFCRVRNDRHHIGRLQFFDQQFELLDLTVELLALGAELHALEARQLDQQLVDLGIAMAQHAAQHR